MKFLPKYTFVREFRDYEDKVELFDNEKNIVVILTWKQYAQLKGYFDNVQFIVADETQT